MSDLLKSPIQLADNVVLREFPTETVALHLGTGQFHGLNPTAAEMLKASLSSPAPADAVGGLAERFGRDPSDIDSDLRELLAELSERQIISASPET
jgi:hypothetical protein